MTSKLKKYIYAIIISLFLSCTILFIIGQASSFIFTSCVVFLVVFFIHKNPINTYNYYPYPTIIILLGLTIIPILFTVFISFYRITGASINPSKWIFVSINNYWEIFTSRFDLMAFFRTFEFSFIAVIIEVLLGLIIGFQLSKISGKMRYVQTIFLIPVILPPLINGMIWRSIFDQSFGLMNRILIFSGFEGITWLSLKSFPVDNTEYARFLNMNLGFLSALIAEIWQWTPFIAVIIGYVVKSVPLEMYSWFKLNSKSKLAIFRFLYLPYLRNILILLFFIRFIDCYKTYETIWTLFGNNIDTATISIRIATYVLDNRNYGVGASLSLTLLIVISYILVIIFKLLRNRIINPK